MFGFFMWTAVITVVLAFIFEFSGLIQPKKNSFFNVRIEAMNQTDPDFVSLIAGYKKQMKWVRWAAILASIPMIFISKISGILLVLTLYFFGYPAIEILSAGHFGNQLKALKKERGWQSRGDNAIKVDLNLAIAMTQKRYFSYKWFFVMLPLCFAPWLFRSEISPWLHWLFMGLSFAVWLGGLIGYQLIKKGRNHVYTEDSEMNILLNYKVKNIWIKTLSTLVAYQLIFHVFLINLTFSLRMDQWLPLTIILVGSLIPLPILFAGYRAYKKCLNGYETLSSYSEEDCWYGGIFYNNPSNPKTFVSKPYSIGTTVNMGTKTGKSLMWGTLISMIILFGFLLYTGIINDFFDPVVVWQDDKVIVKGGSYEAVMPYDTIESVTFLETLSGGYKTNGVATDRYARGKFKYDETGAVKAFIFKDSKPYLYIQASEGKLIYSGRTPEETQQVYETLLKHLP